MTVRPGRTDQPDWDRLQYTGGTWVQLGSPDDEGYLPHTFLSELPSSYGDHCLYRVQEYHDPTDIGTLRAHQHWCAVTCQTCELAGETGGRLDDDGLVTVSLVGALLAFHWTAYNISDDTPTDPRRTP